MGRKLTPQQLVLIKQQFDWAIPVIALLGHVEALDRELAESRAKQVPQIRCDHFWLVADNGDRFCENCGIWHPDDVPDPIAPTPSATNEGEAA